MAKKNLLIGLAELGVGIFLLSPADELAIGAGTGGLSLISAPAQLAGTGIIGIALIYDALKRI